jgi:hypothetical protein
MKMATTKRTIARGNANTVQAGEPMRDNDVQELTPMNDAFAPASAAEGLGTPDGWVSS